MAQEKYFELFNENYAKILKEKNPSFDLYNSIISKRNVRKKYKMLKSLFIKAIIKMKNKKNKNNYQLIFQNCIFRRKNKELAFERKNVHSQFLFYVKYYNGQVNLHILYLLTEKRSLHFFYNITADHVGVEEHKGSIYIAGGKCNSYVNLCWYISLSNLKSYRGKACKELNEKKSNLTLISTPIDLFAIGGYNDNDLKSTERYYLSKAWKFIPNLNYQTSMITAKYIYPDNIYVFGSPDMPGFERINIRIYKNFEIIQVKNSMRIEGGAAFQINPSEIILIGGDDGNNQLRIFNADRKILLNYNSENELSTDFVNSKIRILGDKGYLICTSDKILYEIQLPNMSCNKQNLYF